MSNYLIITEKPSARKNFEKALGGVKGHFADFNFEVISLHGHMMTLADPIFQVPKEHQEKYKSWDLDKLPWNLDEFKWVNQYASGFNPRTKKVQNTKKEIDAIKTKSNQFDGLIIATDTDPSGEGELLAWEVIFAIGWKGKVFRANFVDESEKSIKDSLNNLRDVSDPKQDGDLLKGMARNRWDFASMQLTRAATTASRQFGGYNLLSRQGRLKSAMLLKIYQQEQAIKNYVRVPYFELRFRDNESNVFSRQVSQSELPEFRFNGSEKAEQEGIHFPRTATPSILKEEIKETKPPKLLDLSSLSAILAKEGFQAKEVLNTYQKMYEAQLVSYPRTEDKTITPEQYQDMLPLIESIAKVVGVDSQYLTEREPRPSHVKAQGAHGANRPGSVVPKQLSDLSKYGESAERIYDTLAKNFLAMFAPNYRFRKISANLAEAPAFKTTINQPISQGWKAVFKDDDEDDKKVEPTKLGTIAHQFVFEGQNSKPTAPTWKWLKTFLEKHEIGTGATRTSTYADLTTGNKKQDAYLSDKKGKIKLTPVGLAAAFVVQDTQIANPIITKQIFTIFDQVGHFKLSLNESLQSADQVIQNDIPIIIENAKTMQRFLGKPEKKLEAVSDDRASGLWEPKQKQVSFKRQFSGHRFTDEEVQMLLAGKAIHFEAKSSKGKTYQAEGLLKEQIYKGNKYVGFSLNKK